MVIFVTTMRGKNRAILTIDIAFVVGALLLWWGWEIYSRPIPRGIEISYEEYPVRGIDISSHNGLGLDFERIADQGVKFVYIKASEGETFRDSLFTRNYWGAQRFGLKVGAYHFFRFDCDGVAQARNVISAMAEHPMDLPVAIDVEQWGNPDNVSEELIIKRLSDMIATLKNLGHPVVIYTNKKGYNRLVRNHFEDVPLWICSFTDPPLDDDEDDSQWQLWQHSHVGRLEGVRGKLDLNTFNGSEEEFDQWLEAMMNHCRDSSGDIAVNIPDTECPSDTL